MSLFLKLYGLFLLAGGLILASFTKEEIFLYINTHHSTSGDLFFPVITHLGGGVVTPLIAGASLFLLNFRKAIIGLASFLLSGGIVQLLKRLVFNDEYRPIKYFEGIENIYLIPGMDMYQFHSFPSGHSTTIFSLCCFLALVTPSAGKTRRAVIGILIFLTAVLVAMSRVYISQHFFGDIYVGSLIGVLVTLLVFRYLNSARFDEISWLNANIRQALRRRE